MSVNLSDQRKFDQALEIMTKAEILASTSFGEASASYANVCYHFGHVHHAKGNYLSAEPWFLKCRSIREAVTGTENAEYARCLYRLGVIYYLTGNNYEKAEKYYLEARAIQERTLGKEHSDYAATINSMGNLYYYTGNFQLAEVHYLEAKDIRERVLGKENISYSGSLNNLANVYHSIGNHEQAAELYGENVAIIERTRGKNNAYYAGGIMNLAGTYLARNDFRKTEELYAESKRILEGLPNYTEIPSYMSLVEALGILYEKTGQYAEAISFHEKAKTLRENGLGKEHLSVEMSLAALSGLYWKTGQFLNAAQCFMEASVMRRRFLSDATRHFSEKEVFAYVTSFEKELDMQLSFAAGYVSHAPAFSGTCFDNILFHKGFLLNNSYHFRNADFADPALTDKLTQFKSIQAQLSTEYAKPPSERNHGQIAQLETQANTLEKDLARTIANFGETIRQVNWQQVQAALSPDAATVEFVHFKYFKPEPTDSVLYAALLLTPGMEQPLFIPLFEEKSLEALLPPPGKNRSEYVSNVYRNEAIAALIWSPIEPYLQGVNMVYHSPSGLLNRLNLGALPDAAGTPFFSRREIVQLSSSRQLGTTPASRSKSGISAVPQTATATATLFGGIQYDMDSTAIAPAATDALAINTRGLAFSETDSTLRGGSWKYLKNSEKETTNIAGILEQAGIPATAFRGYAATEEAFKRMSRQGSSPLILHLSTHGYFFPDAGNGKAGEPVFKSSDHPMIRSGLILAGANHAWQTGRPLGNREDGILTAYEISQLDMRNSELVVLSACETGLGDIRGNEGVYGLQRAFKIAGAKNLIMSLWQVPDFQTQELMTLFYQNWLLEKMTVHRALQAAQDEMRQRGYEPFYWAGFGLVE